MKVRSRKIVLLQAGEVKTSAECAEWWVWVKSRSESLHVSPWRQVSKEQWQCTLQCNPPTCWHTHIHIHTLLPTWGGWALYHFNIRPEIPSGNWSANHIMTRRRSGMEEMKRIHYWWNGVMHKKTMSCVSPTWPLSI